MTTINVLPKQKTETGLQFNRRLELARKENPNCTIVISTKKDTTAKVEKEEAKHEAYLSSMKSNGVNLYEKAEKDMENRYNQLINSLK